MPQNKELFELSHDQKMNFAHPPRPNPHRGYSYVGQEKLSGVSGFERGEKVSVKQTDLKVANPPAAILYPPSFSN